MSYQVEKVSSNQQKISFEIPAAAFEEAMQKAYLKMRGRINVPGFRKGKAPRKLIENMYGEGVFYDKAFDLIFPDAYKEAVEAEDLFPVDQPEITLDQIGGGQELKFSATVYVRPDVTLGDYKTLKATRHLHPITPEQIENRIARDVEKVTMEEDIGEEALQEGDTASIDYLGSVDGVPFAGGEGKGHKLVLGSQTFIPGFEEQVAGMKAGEEKDINVTFPEKYHAEALAGKEAVFHVKVNAGTRRVKPEMDDEFAQDVSEFSTLAEYKEGIEKELTELRDKHAETHLENDLIQQAVDAADCDIPEALIQRQMDYLLQNMRIRMLYQGLRFEDYLKYTNTTQEEVRENFRQDAVNNVKTDLVLYAIAKQEGFEASPEEVDEEIKRHAQETGREFESYKSSLNENQMENFKDVAINRKVVNLLKENAQVTDHTEAHEELTVKDIAQATQAIEEAAEVAEESIVAEEPAKTKPAKAKKAAKEGEEKAGPKAKKAPAKKKDETEDNDK
ncbi:MAG: trigger factor [Christensenellales bacterium]|jgi:trigger factor